MPKKRKLVTMLVTVAAPAGVGGGEARGIVRLAIANGIELNPGLSNGVKLRTVRPAAATLAAAEKARQAWGKPRYPKPSRKAKRPPLLEAMGAE